LARSLQEVTEELMLRLCANLYRESGQKNLCMAGGVALNCVANGRILREGPFENVWVQPASGDAGASLGVALAIANVEGGPSPQLVNGARDHMQGAYLGPSFDQARIADDLDRLGGKYRDVEDDELFGIAADALNDGKVVGWFQGRMEFGPRALGNRSILGDPRSPSMQRMLNLKIKYRESFRPFAPAILDTHAGDFFDLDVDSPYMLLVASVHGEHHRDLSATEIERQGLEMLDIARSDIPAVTHVDYSARIQTVHADTNPRFYRLLEVFKDRSGCPMLINTSFNVRDEPIVCSPEDAFLCFMGTEMDVLVINNFLLFKEDQ